MRFVPKLDSSMLGGMFEEFRRRLSDFAGAFLSGDGAALRREIGSQNFLEQATSFLKKLGQVDVDTLKAMRYVLQSTIQMYQESFRRRQAGEYEVDEFGLDHEFLDLVRPLFAFLYKKWWRVSVQGIENVPSDGPALLVANHSGILPWDGGMIAYAVYSERTPPRIVRALYLDWFTQMPFVHPFLTRTGQVFACPENAERLLRRGNLAVVFPEGIKGVGKLFKDRYKLARFGRGGFVRVAMRAKASIIPVSVMGAEEIYPCLARPDWIGKPIGAPFFPITPLWPWFGMLGFLPLPSKWTITFGKPISTAEYTERDAANFLVLQRLTRRVRDEIQETLQKGVLRRKSVFV